MSDTNLAERVNDLEERVAYLEHELELSVEERRFERQVQRIAAGQKYEIAENGLGSYSATIEVAPGDVPFVAGRIDEIDGIGWDVEDSSEDSVTVRVEQGLINK